MTYFYKLLLAAGCLMGASSVWAVETRAVNACAGKAAGWACSYTPLCSSTGFSSNQARKCSGPVSGTCKMGGGYLSCKK